MGILLGKTPQRRFALLSVIGPASLSSFSFVTKCDNRISRERYDLESQNVTGIHTGRVYNHTGYDVTNFLWLDATAKKPRKRPPQTPSGVISLDLFMRGSPNFIPLSGITGPTNVPDMTSLVK